MNNLLNREVGDVTKVEAKPFWQSKVLWFNLVTLALQVANVLSTSPIFADKVQILEILTMVQTFGNIILRLISTQPLALK